ncbi:MAG: hypothetical protein EP305_11285 [Bacteroidetes bacterium]|nr:MAG: hypothetical protein EP305_11285 [Bacteroidota bacterium]
MKITFYSIIVVSLFFGMVSCKKDKVTTTLDPNCTDTVYFNQEILPLITDNCSGCHGSGNSTGYTLTNHTNISSNATASLNAMRGDGFQLMPQGGPALNDSLIQKFNCWINQGKLNN